MTIDSADDSKISNRTINNTNRISNRTYDSKSNRITKLRRSSRWTRPCLVYRKAFDSVPHCRLIEKAKDIWYQKWLDSFLTMKVGLRGNFSQLLHVLIVASNMAAFFSASLSSKTQTVCRYGLYAVLRAS